MEKDMQEIRERLIKIETLLEANNKGYDEKLSVANHRIADLENTVTWLWRTSVVGLISAICSLAFIFIQKII